MLIDLGKIRALRSRKICVPVNKESWHFAVLRWRQMLSWRAEDLICRHASAVRGILEAETAI